MSVQSSVNLSSLDKENLSDPDVNEIYRSSQICCEMDTNVTQNRPKCRLYGLIKLKINDDDVVQALFELCILGSPVRPIR